MVTPNWEAIKTLVQNHFEVEPGLTQVYVFIRNTPTPGGEQKVPIVHLLEVNRETIPTEEPETFSFGPTEEHPFVTEITEVTPDEFEELADSEEWPIDSAQKFERPVAR